MLTRKQIISSAATLPWLVAGCASPLHMQSIGYAEPVGEWRGLGRITRDGEVYFAGQPTQEALREARRRGVKVVVNLRPDDEMTTRVDFDEAALVRELGMAYVSIPVTPDSLSVAEMDRLQEALSRTTGPVLIHCASSNRVGGLWALYLHRHRHFSLEGAMERGKKAGLRSDAMIRAVRRVASVGGNGDKAS